MRIQYSDYLRVGRPGFDFRQGQGPFSHVHIHTGSRPTNPPIQWVPGALSPGVKQPGREADHLPPSLAEF